ncbi:arsenate reductase (azurin) small subunit [Azoarcus sp. DN11]|uniref:arsenate reductase (azurin) small subunit n=1 Tax=Azoarcus sp. DN11 TaxID=356837 RepID=UPI000EAB5DA5|nr:arsenate reductase (azurin) small subunit [Azoarcus sp. DN11]AYH44093.1 arsenate reductase (azurin) small subunit [Azoarcus sp. DN11]
MSQTSSQRAIQIRQPAGHDHDHEGGRTCMSRRSFLLTGGAALALVSLGGIPGFAEAAQLLKASYARQKIGSLSALKVGEPLTFNYPYADVRNILVKLGAPAGGGIGPDSDIVAFNQQCTHMGGPLDGTYKPGHQVLGPCPLHLTSFDLTRHGMVVAGHATESLPQITLEVQGDDIYAVGVMGLVYGYSAMTAEHRA